MNKARCTTGSRLVVGLCWIVLAAGAVAAGEPFVLMDIRPGEDSSSPKSLARFGDVVLFSAFEESAGSALWRTDGTEAGTYLLAETVYGEGIDLGNGEFLFGSNRELWRTDGTIAGTWMVADGFRRSPQDFAVLDGVALFSSATDTRQGRELYRSDGTEAGTYLVKEIGQQRFSGAPTEMTELNGVMVMSAAHAVLGPEPYLTDGTFEGTVPLLDIHPLVTINGNTYPRGSYPDNLTRIGDAIYFVAEDPEHGRELWITDGTTEGTVLVADIRPGVESAFVDEGWYGKDGIVAPGGAGVLFVADDGVHGRELWTSDGTEIGTQMVLEIVPGPADGIPLPDSSSVGDLLVGIDDRVFFAADDRAHGLELWVSDGTAAGTRLVKEVRPGPEGSRIRQLQIAAGRVLFAADDGVHGSEPYTSDGTAIGTATLGDLRPGEDWSMMSRAEFVAIGDRLIFNAFSAERGHELWAADLPPMCRGRQATVYVDENGKVRGGLLEGQAFFGTLHGTAVGDVIVGTDEDDMILAHGGDDLVCAGDGNDTVLGHDGNDVLDGQAGRDSMNGGAGDDEVLESDVQGSRRLRFFRVGAERR